MLNCNFQHHFCTFQRKKPEDTEDLISNFDAESGVSKVTPSSNSVVNFDDADFAASTKHYGQLPHPPAYVEHRTGHTGSDKQETGSTPAAMTGHTRVADELDSADIELMMEHSAHSESAVATPTVHKLPPPPSPNSTNLPPPCQTQSVNSPTAPR